MGGTPDANSGCWARLDHRPDHGGTVGLACRGWHVDKQCDRLVAVSNIGFCAAHRQASAVDNLVVTKLAWLEKATAARRVAHRARVVLVCHAFVLGSV